MEFFSSDSSSLFLNSTFGAFNILSQNFSNAPIYPIANPAVRLDFQPTPKFDFKVSFSSDNEISDPTTTNQHGVFFDIKSRDGILFAVEGSYLVNQAPGDDGLVASYRLGSFIQRGDYTTFLSQATSEIGVGNLSHRGDNYAFYGVIDREIYKKDGRDVTVFARGGFAPKRYSFVDGYFDAGFNWRGIFQKYDVVGLGVAYSAVSGEFSNASLLRGGPEFTSETVLEASYRFWIKPWWNIQPDLQYIFTPGGSEGARDAFVLGVRTTVTF
jgi:porin